MLNYLWGGFFLVSFAVAAVQFFNGNTGLFEQMVQSTFDMAKLSVDIALGLVGLLALWSGLFRIAEKAGLVSLLSKGLEPFFFRVMPTVPRGHDAQGAVTMNLAANMLGMDNAATPLGLKAMQLLQGLNPDKRSASDAQILFLVLNTSSVTLLPVTIFLYRAQLGAADPTEVFVPILLATSASTLVGLLSVMLIQRVRFDLVVLAYLGSFILMMVSGVYWLSSLAAADLSEFSQWFANGLLLLIMVSFIATGLYKGVAVYEEFVEGAKEGFFTAIKIIPYLVAMLIAIGLLRSSGALDLLLRGVATLFSLNGLAADVLEAMPVALMKPFSGSGARALMLEAMNTHGVDSFVGKLVATMQGSTETTFYVLTVYFGVVGITRIRYALWCGLLCDFVGMAAAIALGIWFFS